MIEDLSGRRAAVDDVTEEDDPLVTPPVYRVGDDQGLERQQEIETSVDVSDGVDGCRIGRDLDAWPAFGLCADRQCPSEAVKPSVDWGLGPWHVNVFPASTPVRRIGTGDTDDLQPGLAK